MPNEIDLAITQTTAAGVRTWPPAQIVSAYVAWLKDRPDTPDTWTVFMAGALSGWRACNAESDSNA